MGLKKGNARRELKPDGQLPLFRAIVTRYPKFRYSIVLTPCAPRRSLLVGQVYVKQQYKDAANSKLSDTIKLLINNGRGTAFQKEHRGLGRTRKRQPEKAQHRSRSKAIQT